MKIIRWARCALPTLQHLFDLEMALHTAPSMNGLIQFMGKVLVGRVDLPRPISH